MTASREAGGLRPGAGAQRERRIMDAIALFKRCRERRAEILLLEREEAALDAAMTGCGGGGGGGVRGTQHDRFAGYMSRKDALLRREKTLRRLLVAEQVAVNILTGALPNEKRRDAMRLYWGRGRSAAQVAMEMNYSLRHIERIVAEDLQLMGRLDGAEVDAALPGWYLKWARENRIL